MVQRGLPPATVGHPAACIWGLGMPCTRLHHCNTLICDICIYAAYNTHSAKIQPALQWRTLVCSTTVPLALYKVWTPHEICIVMLLALKPRHDQGATLKSDRQCGSNLEQAAKHGPAGGEWVLIGIILRSCVGCH